LRPVRKILLALLLCAAFLPPRAALAQAGGRALTLDETISAINEAAGAQGVFRWDPFFQEGSFAVGGHHGVFSAALSPGQSGFLMLNNRDLHPVPLPHFEGGELLFPEAFVATARRAFERAARDNFQYRIAAIIIDAGHGGRDPGASSTHTINGRTQTLRESDVALRAAGMLRDMLSSRFPDKRVLMTRESDIFLSLDERSFIANSVPLREHEAIIFVSIHANSAPNENARGFEVWHLTPEYRRDLLDESQFPDNDLRQILNMLTEEAFLTESILIAQAILDGMDAAMGGSMPNRGLMAGNWFVVRRSAMPAVLVELGFISNAEDAALMASDAGLRRMVAGVYAGIANFVEAFEASGGFTVAQ